MTVSFGLKAAHEQFSPRQLLEYAVLAEKVGIHSIWASDHFHPWAHSDAHSGFAWIWMASAAEKTTNMIVGTGVTAPTFRYHPAIVAQAFGTLGHLYPGRVRLGLGTGEALNEVPLGYAWPSGKERHERLEEAIKIIRMLWDGDFVSYRGKYYTLRNAKMYTKAKHPVPLYLAAFGPKMARLAGKHADAFYSFLSQPPDYYKNTLFPAVRKSAEEAGRDFGKMNSSIEMLFSYDENIDKAMESVRFWGGSLLPVFFKYGISDPREIEEHGRKVGSEVMKKTWVITTTPDDIIQRAESCYDAGFKHL
ncbi:MAG: TIGR03557 family F420-dependent LLM class oxidoreductase, partial [Candidatus Bathyarchaeia archaeon]